MAAHGILPLHFTPRQIRAERSNVVTKIRGSLTSGRSRPLPHIRALPAS
jgi:hypothetical protein